MQTLLNLLSAIALLVWGTHIVRTGVIRVWGGSLRKTLGASTSTRGRAFLAGLGVTSLIQSSSATALMTMSFVSQRLIGIAPALAIMLGADVGTSLIVQVFSFDLSWLSPLLIFTGVVLFITKQATTAGRVGRILIGFGLIILALQLTVLAAKPVMAATGVKVLFASLSGDPMLDMLIGALLTVFCYSSLAVVLLTATLAGSDVISVKVALGLVLGANLGSGLLAIIMTLRLPAEARQVPLGNFMFKLAGCLVFLPLLGHTEALLAAWTPDTGRLVVTFHLAFNVILAAAFIRATGPMARLAARLLPADPARDLGVRPRHLDEGALDTPTLAITCAAREALRIADTVETMLAGMLRVICDNDRKLSQDIRAMDDTVDSLYTGVKLYLAKIPRSALSDRESRRWTDIISFTINMEQIGDIVERVLEDVDDRKIRKGVSFSDAGMGELTDLHARLLANLRLGMTVFLDGDLDGDLDSARRLLAEKVNFRDLERAYADSHLQRLSGNTVQSIETSALHLDLLSEMKRINSHICSIAYPILEEAGVLTRSRLRDTSGQAPDAAAAPTRFPG